MAPEGSVRQWSAQARPRTLSAQSNGEITVAVGDRNKRFSYSRST